MLQPNNLSLRAIMFSFSIAALAFAMPTATRLSVPLTRTSAQPAMITRRVRSWTQRTPENVAMTSALIVIKRVSCDRLFLAAVATCRNLWRSGP